MPTKRSSVGSPISGLRAGKVDVVGDQHDLAGADLGAERPGGVGEDERVAAERPERRDRRRAWRRHCRSRSSARGRRRRRPAPPRAGRRRPRSCARRRSKPGKPGRLAHRECERRRSTESARPPRPEPRIDADREGKIERARISAAAGVALSLIVTLVQVEGRGKQLGEPEGLAACRRGRSTWTSVSGAPNSARRWRQPPQGVVRRPSMRLGDDRDLGDLPSRSGSARRRSCGRSPRSRRTSPRDRSAFSTLQPAWTVPASVRKRGADGEARIGRVGVVADACRRLEQIAVHRRSLRHRRHRSSAPSDVRDQASAGAGGQGGTRRLVRGHGLSGHASWSADPPGSLDDRRAKMPSLGLVWLRGFADGRDYGRWSVRPGNRLAGSSQFQIIRTVNRKEGQLNQRIITVSLAALADERMARRHERTGIRVPCLRRSPTPAASTTRASTNTPGRACRTRPRSGGFETKLLESKAETDYVPNINSFVAAKCDVIVTVGFLLGDATKAAADANPEHQVHHRRLRLRSDDPERARPGLRDQPGGIPRRLPRGRHEQDRHRSAPSAASTSAAGHRLHGRLRLGRRLLQQAEGQVGRRCSAGIRPRRKACSSTTSPRSTRARTSPRA